MREGFASGYGLRDGEAKAALLRRSPNEPRVSIAHCSLLIAHYV